MKAVYCKKPNLWTSKGKFLFGEAIEGLPEEEIKTLGKKVSTSKPENDDA